MGPLTPSPDLSELPYMPSVIVIPTSQPCTGSLVCHDKGFGIAEFEHFATVYPPPGDGSSRTRCFCLDLS